MSWEPITNMSQPSNKVPKVPIDGVAVQARKLNVSRGAKKTVRFIKILIGAGLAKKLCLIGDETRLRLSLGAGKYAGNVSMAVDVKAGSFPARKGRDGNYVLTINEASAAGLFSLDFPAFTALASPVVPPPAGPPMLAFAAGAMLDAED